ncbi:hypothetical protein ACFL2J_06990 [Candidatus Omnitrophota bacterium]
MSKRWLVLLLCVCLVISMGATLALAQGEEVEEITIEGTLQEVAADKSYIIVNDTKIITDAEFLEYCDIVIGDKVSILVDKTEEGIEAYDYDYLYDEAIETEMEESQDSFEDIWQDSESSDASLQGE